MDTDLDWIYSVMNDCWKTADGQANLVLIIARYEKYLTEAENPAACKTYAEINYFKDSIKNFKEYQAAYQKHHG